MDNKPGEPAFQLRLDLKDAVVFRGALGALLSVNVKLTNITADRQAYKVGRARAGIEVQVLRCR